MFVTLAHGVGEARNPVSSTQCQTLMPARLEPHMLRMCPGSDTPNDGVKGSRASGGQSPGSPSPSFSSVKDGVRIGLALMLLRNPALRQKLAALAQAIAAQQPHGVGARGGDDARDKDDADRA